MYTTVINIFCYGMSDAILLAEFIVYRYFYIYIKCRNEPVEVLIIQNIIRIINILTMLKTNFISAIYSKSLWTGGNDLASEGEWHWVGSLLPMTYTNWYRYQPDNGHNREHCMELERRYRYRWNDQPCHLLNHFICEIYMY